jgi:hypothetical protein
MKTRGSRLDVDLSVLIRRACTGWEVLRGLSAGHFAGQARPCQASHMKRSADKGSLPGSHHEAAALILAMRPS